MKKLNKERLNRILTERLENDIRKAKTAGAELYVSQYGETICHITKGIKDAETGEELQPNAMYRLASMTKPVTAVAALIALDKGWFSLDDEVREYLPDFSDMDVAVLENGEIVVDHKAHTQLKIYQMLSHCSGILAETKIGAAISETVKSSDFLTNDTFLKYVSKQPLAFDPGECAAYTGRASFDVIAHIIEMKSGMKYSDFLKEHVFNPLGIKDITYHPTQEQWERMVAVHDRSDFMNIVKVKLPDHTIYEGGPLTYEGAGSGLAGSLHDYAIFAEMLCNKGTYKGKELIQPELIEEMRKPRIPKGVFMYAPNDSWIEGDNWGLGVRVKEQTSRLPIGAFGWSGAYGTHFWVDPENGITAILMRNMRWFDTQGCGQMGVRFETDVMSCLEK